MWMRWPHLGRVLNFEFPSQHLHLHPPPCRRLTTHSETADVYSKQHQQYHLCVALIAFYFLLQSIFHTAPHLQWSARERTCREGSAEGGAGRSDPLHGGMIQTTALPKPIQRLLGLPAAIQGSIGGEGGGWRGLHSMCCAASREQARASRGMIIKAAAGPGYEDQTTRTRHGFPRERHKDLLGQPRLGLGHCRGLGRNRCVPASSRHSPQSSHFAPRVTHRAGIVRLQSLVLMMVFALRQHISSQPSSHALVPWLLGEGCQAE